MMLLQELSLPLVCILEARHSTARADHRGQHTPLLGAPSRRRVRTSQKAPQHVGRRFGSRGGGARLADPDPVRKHACRQVGGRGLRLARRWRAPPRARVAAPGQHAVVRVVPGQQRTAHLSTAAAVEKLARQNSVRSTQAYKTRMQRMSRTQHNCAEAVY